MTNPDRKTAPAFKEIEKVEILRAQKNKLKNGVPVYFINAGTEEVLKIDFIFQAGTYASIAKSPAGLISTPLLATAVNHLIPEGTLRLSSTEIAENIDYFGAFIQTDCDKDIGTVSLITLNKHLKSTLSLLEEIIKDAVFPEKEMDTYLQNTKQKFIVDSEKVHVVSRRKFNEVIFGKGHPYGKNVELEDFGSLSREELIKFFKKLYSAGNCQIIVSGKINEGVFSALDEHFGNWLVEARHVLSPLHGQNASIQPSSEKKHFIERKGQVQSAIRIGRPLFSKKHHDYPAMKILNVLLGGYFGSRLMTNIREDKGYTYGIGSAVFPLVHEGCFFISTEVGADVTAAAVKEIYYEISQLRDKEVSLEELQKVRNYMLGEFIRSIDGPFALAERLKGLLVFGLDYDYYDNFINTIKNTSPGEIQGLANKYLQKADLYEVVVGSGKN